LQVVPEEGEGDMRVALVEELRGRVLHCVADQNGNHVIQKIVECLPSDSIEFVLEVRPRSCLFLLNTHGSAPSLDQRYVKPIHCGFDMGFPFPGPQGFLV